MRRIIFCMVALCAAANAQTMWDAEPDYWIPGKSEEPKTQVRTKRVQSPLAVPVKQQLPQEVKPEEPQKQCAPCVQPEPALVQIEELEIESFWAKNGKLIGAGGLAIVALGGAIFYGWNYLKNYKKS